MKKDANEAWAAVEEGVEVAGETFREFVKMAVLGWIPKDHEIDALSNVDEYEGRRECYETEKPGKVVVLEVPRKTL